MGIGAFEHASQRHGRGIAEADMERILAPFEQAGKSTINVTNQGVGLGLAITQKLVELHGGTLEVESELGEGSTFLISLPLQEEKSPLPPLPRWTNRDVH